MEVTMAGFEFLIDLPYHKRWYLPDRVHVYNSVIYGDQLRWSIFPIGNPTNGRESGVIDISKPDWQELSFLSQELAAKKYPRGKRA